MRNRHLILLLSVLLATFLVAGCGGSRQATKAETDQFNAISGKIAQAENMTPKGAKECAPKELAVAKAELDGVRHQSTEDWDDSTKTGPWSDSTIDKASKAADAALAKTKACQPPIVNYSAAPETIAPGQCSTLTWSTQNVQKAEIDQEVGAVAASGSKQVCPKETTQYMLTATGTGGTVYETATVTVMAPVPPPPPVAAVGTSISANPTYVYTGQCTTLTWSTQNATDVVIDPGVGKVGPSGSKQVCPTDNTTYTISATNAGGTKTASTTVPVYKRTTLQINFDTAKADIRKKDLPELQKAIEFVKKYPNTKVQVVGFTDSRGTDKYNQKLSERRANAVKKYLVDNGHVKPDMITAVGYGEAEPVGDNKTKEGQFLNRRVEIREAK
ncbi:MAG: OmpA family protein [Deltaproteobacteria bacterium]|nr:OmpA family protein [Candidatus Deferrimicrobium borealis]